MVSISDILPEASAHLTKPFGTFAGIAAMLAMLFGALLGSLGLGVLNGHTPAVSSEKASLTRVGLATMIAVTAHNIPEGIASYMAGIDNRSLGITVTVAIALHNIPEGISIAIPLLFSSKSRKKAALFAVISGLGEPLGALLAMVMLRPFITPFSLGFILGAAAGLMIFVSFYELIPSAIHYGINSAVTGVLLGITAMGVALTLL